MLKRSAYCTVVLPILRPCMNVCDNASHMSGNMAQRILLAKHFQAQGVGRIINFFIPPSTVECQNALVTCAHRGELLLLLIHYHFVLHHRDDSPGNEEILK